MGTMRTGLALAVGAAVLAGCGRADAGAAVDDGLRQDLALAGAVQPEAITLPGTGGTRTLVVSAAELTPRAAPKIVRASASPRSPRKARVKATRVVRRAGVVAAVPTPAPAPAPVAVVAAAEPAPAESPAPAEAVIENPRPVPVPAPAPDDAPRGGGWGGVVIRGGGVDGDHCERDRPGRRGIGGMISINVQGPMGRGTFGRY